MEKIELEFVGVDDSNNNAATDCQNITTDESNFPPTNVPSLNSKQQISTKKGSAENHNSAADKIFQCSLCEDLLSTITELENHSRTHFGSADKLANKNKSFECYECGESFKTSINLLSHRRIIHNLGKPYSCSHESCDRRFTRSEDLHIHLRVHKGLSVFECCYCDRMFAQSDNLANHILNFHKSLVDSENYELLENGLISNLLNPERVDNEESVPVAVNVVKKNPVYIRKYKCPRCELSFIKMKSLEIHCNRNHVGQVDKTQLQEIEDEVDKNSLKDFMCTLCKEAFESNLLLLDHFRLSHPQEVEKPFKCAKCGTAFAQSDSLFEHVKTHNAKNNKCKYCSFTYFQQHSLIKHLKKHEGPNVKYCEICKIPYNDQKDLDKHLRTHANGKPHKCPYCDKYFAQSCDKMKHIRIHTKEKPYECEICHKKFAHLTSIKKHHFVHSGERNFQCFICGKSFQHKSNLVVHNRTHSGERPFKCEICSKSFYASGHYTDHLKIHTGEKNYKCEICDKMFLHQSSFQKHKKMHAGEKNHQCSVCFKKFSQPGHYREHLRIHSGELPFTCEICNRAFRRSDALKTHMKIHSAANNSADAEVTTEENDCVDVIASNLSEDHMIFDPASSEATMTTTSITFPASTQIIHINSNDIIKLENCEVIGHTDEYNQETHAPLFIIRQPLMLASDATDAMGNEGVDNSLQQYFQF